MPVTASFGVPAGALASLGATRPSPGDARLLAAGLHSRRLVLLKSLLARAQRHAVPTPVRQRLERHWQLLERAEASAPAAARAALAYPSVGNWLLHVLSVPAGDDAAPGETRFEDALGGLGALAAAAALSTGTGFRVTLPAPGGRLTLPGIGSYTAHDSCVRLVAGPRSLRLSPAHRRTGTVLRPPYAHAAVADWHGLRPLPGTPAAMLDDLDPYRAGTRPVDRFAPPITGSSTGGGRARDWNARWRAALSLLEAADPARRSEVFALVRSVVPLARTPGGTSSGTLRSAPGCVLTELPENAEDMAAVLVHEVQHSKLAVLSDVAPLHHANGAALHGVPWRPDARPLDAVLQGTYAHLALADLWHRLTHRAGATPAARARARARCEDYREQVASPLAMLRESGELTRHGREFADGMARHHARLGRAPGAAASGRPSSVTIRNLR
ncbi:HEXXH motif-containing protein [Streptomyces sp. Amel2xB2]|uniref:aKG-HExxH-type peptide beta-hydroxylase n=1 Tax=Streptomyces sp. Amel2xB2 TaxID=1305829 RepID=UPI000DC025BB|nr:HEXXH motif-containing putative peptide modification protein [Streptomyces sp. Amel2xB2]RAJ71382.1 HEXXH motif-containing protein [Streptomyces sp. Amel2xB2]